MRIMVKVASLVAPCRTPSMEVWLTYSDFFPEINKSDQTTKRFAMSFNSIQMSVIFIYFLGRITFTLVNQYSLCCLNVWSLTRFSFSNFKFTLSPYRWWERSLHEKIWLESKLFRSGINKTLFFNKPLAMICLWWDKCVYIIKVAQLDFFRGIPLKFEP